MRQVQLHGYIREDGGVTVSPDVMGGTEDRKGRVRLVADEGKAITNGEVIATVIDVDVADVGNWTDCEMEEMML